MAVNAPTPTTATIRGRPQTQRGILEDQVVDYQAELDELAAKQASHAADLRADIERDAADDRRRFWKYSAVEKAIRHGSKNDQLAAFHSLVAHVEGDELIEDERRVGHEAALRLLALKTALLRRIFRTDFVPRILASIKDGRS